MFGHLRSFKGWIQTEACVIPNYPMAETEKQIKTISVAVVPSRQRLCVQPKLKHNNVHLIRYSLTAIQDCPINVHPSINVILSGSFG